jgi:hypothetical protein
MKLLSARLWQALNNPPHNHPLFLRVSDGTVEPKAVNNLISIGGLLLVGFIFLIPLLAIPMMVIGANGLLALRVGGTLAYERERGMYDLLAIQPAGPLFAEWIIGVREYHRFYSTSFYRQFDDSYHRFMRFDRFNTLILIAVLLFFLPMSPVIFVLVWLIMYESRHLRLNALLIGIICGDVPNRLEAQVRAAGIFGLLQLLVYLLIVAIAFLCIAFFTASGGLLNIVVGVISVTAIVLIALMGIREGLLTLLWRILLRRANADAAMLRQITLS